MWPDKEQNDKPANTETREVFVKGGQMDQLDERMMDIETEEEQKEEDENTLSEG